LSNLERLLAERRRRNDPGARRRREVRYMVLEIARALLDRVTRKPTRPDRKNDGQERGKQAIAAIAMYPRLARR
jgi:hypothetical protein